MPYKHETLKIPMPRDKDRRVKLTNEQRDWIKEHGHEYSQRKLAQMFGVSRRLIQFILHPEKLAENKRRREERGGWRQYYDKDEHAKTVLEHRRYKQKVLSNGSA